MTRIAYVAGRYEAHGAASVSIDDRGYQFGDGVYEGIAVFAGALVDLDAHQKRLDRSLKELSIPRPMSDRAQIQIYRQVIRKNRITDGFLYVQITRGVARRDHAFPLVAPRPVLAVTCKPLNYNAIRSKARQGVKTVTTPDQRWGRCDIKSINLLPNVLGKQKARSEGAFEALMLDQNGCLTEGTSANLWIVQKDKLITRSIADNILAGVTRATVMQIASERQMTIEERPIPLEEALSADEIFLTGTTSCVMPVIAVDKRDISTGKPGQISLRLVDLYFDHMANTQNRDKDPRAVRI